jgi:dTDP-4-dehydrorhamnose reductase
MLGHAVYEALKDDFELTLTVRSLDKVALLEQQYGRVKAKAVAFDAAAAYEDYSGKQGGPGRALEKLLRECGSFDYVVNCIGVTIPFASKDPALTFFVNGALPHVLAGSLGERFIHITTDCAFSGKAGFPYDENSAKSPTDLYGLSKSLGEPTACLKLRK